MLAQPEEVGISLDEVPQQMLDEGARLFAQSLEKLIKAIQLRRDEVMSGRRAAQSATAPE